MDTDIFPDVVEINRILEKSIDFHCHGVGRFDFTDVPPSALIEIEELLSERKQRVVLTLYLLPPKFDSFLQLMESFHHGRAKGQFKHIAGFALEGPILASHGGTPERGVWYPTKGQWRELAACGQQGLIYSVISPDAQLSHCDYSVTWIAETLLEGGILPAPGHFTKTDPIESAKALQAMFDVVSAWGYGSTLTDHLFNDMPHNFKHAWRTAEEKVRRAEEIKTLGIESWSLASLEENLGPVPAVMIKNARKGLVKICQNFDGEHVDLAIAKKAVELAGAENMLMITDSIESKVLAGKTLSMQAGSSLLYQEEGIVAAGSQSVFHQIKNMFTMGLNHREIELMTHAVPLGLLNQHAGYIKERADAQTANI